MCDEGGGGYVIRLAWYGGEAFSVLVREARAAGNMIARRL
jgi:hypothetical protein